MIFMKKNNYKNKKYNKTHFIVSIKTDFLHFISVISKFITNRREIMKIRHEKTSLSTLNFNYIKLNNINKNKIVILNENIMK